MSTRICTRFWFLLIIVPTDVCLTPGGGERGRGAGWGLVGDLLVAQTLEGAFSVVSKPVFATKGSSYRIF